MGMMNATFKMDGCHTLRVGTDLQLADTFSPRGYVALILERDPLRPPACTNGPEPTPMCHPAANDLAMEIVELYRSHQPGVPTVQDVVALVDRQIQRLVGRTDYPTFQTVGVLKASHARALASAILASAQEAQRSDD